MKKDENMDSMINSTDIAKYNDLQKNMNWIDGAVKETLDELEKGKYRLVEVRTPGPYSTEDMPHFDKVELYLKNHDNAINPTFRLGLNDDYTLRRILVNREFDADKDTCITEDIACRLNVYFAALEFSKPAPQQREPTIDGKDLLATYSLEQRTALSEGKGSDDAVFAFQQVLERAKIPMPTGLQQRVNRIHQPTMQ